MNTLDLLQTYDKYLVKLQNSISQPEQVLWQALEDFALPKTSFLNILDIYDLVEHSVRSAKLESSLINSTYELINRLRVEFNGTISLLAVSDFIQCLQNFSDTQNIPKRIDLIVRQLRNDLVKAVC
jgi:hypothetical protein